jgi:hypothetical protein
MSYSEQSLEYARRQSAALREKPKTELSLAEDKVNRQRAAEAAEEILDQFPEVHSMILNAYQIWGVWELEVFDIFDKNGKPLADQEDIRRFILQEAISYSEFIRPFEIHSGEIVTLHELITAAKEDRAANYGHIENEFFDKGLQTCTRKVPSKIFAIQLTENEANQKFSPEYRAKHNSNQQIKNVSELQKAVSEAGMKLRLGDPHLEHDQHGNLVSMTFLVNADLSDGMAVRKLLPGDWLVVEPLVGNPLGEVMTNEQFRKHISQ